MDWKGTSKYVSSIQSTIDLIVIIASPSQVNNLSHYVLINRLLPLMKKTAEVAPKASVRIVMQSSEMHKVAPGDTKFASKEEVNKDRDGAQLQVSRRGPESTMNYSQFSHGLPLKIRTNQIRADPPC